MLAWRRIKPVLIACLIVSLLMLTTWKASYLLLLGRLLIGGGLLLLVFGVLEHSPRRLPKFLARWVLQVLRVAFLVPVAFALTYALTTYGDPQYWWLNASRMNGFRMMVGVGVLVAPRMAISALLTQISGEAQHQALAFALERSELERQALAARMGLLQAQVEPHFLFNKLANVRELVDAQSPQASKVLASLIGYMRAAVPRLHDPTSTVQQEMELVRAYLDVMHMRMSDRLQFLLHADDAVRMLDCPAMTLLTLVENAVRHGIDPSEEGGRIEVRVQLSNGRCHAQVIDTGVEFRQTTAGLGTGLNNLCERLQLAFGGDAQLQLIQLEPHGVCAEAEFPARPTAA